jgi:hypothetical protein
MNQTTIRQQHRRRLNILAAYGRILRAIFPEGSPRVDGWRMSDLLDPAAKDLEEERHAA